LAFQISSAKQKIETYQVYVKHNGDLKGSIYNLDDLECDRDGNFTASVEITSGLGTIPETPDSKLTVTAFLKDDKTNQEISGGFFQYNLSFQNVLPFLKSEGVSVLVKYGDKVLTLAQNKKLSQMKAVAYGLQGFPLIRAIPADKGFEVYGYGFNSRDKYTVKIGNELSDKSFVADAQFLDLNRLSGALPALPNGSYSVGIFQNDTLMNSLVHTISSNEQEKSISQIWTRPNEYPSGDRNFFMTNKITLEKGKPFFANPLPAVLGRMYQGFDPSQTIPDLQLKSTTQTVAIKATVRSDASFADGSIRLYYGEYITPANITSGLYEARLVYPDKSVSLPFWSKIEVK
jgi:hypothetical protein